jgi:hypothetical protein
MRRSRICAVLCVCKLHRKYSQARNEEFSNKFHFFSFQNKLETAHEVRLFQAYILSKNAMNDKTNFVNRCSSHYFEESFFLYLEFLLHPYFRLSFCSKNIGISLRSPALIFNFWGGLVSNIFTVGSLASLYADRELAYQNHLPEQEFERLRKNIEYNFKVSGANLASIATITILGIALISQSIFAIAAFVLAYNVRNSFMKSVLLTGVIDQYREDELPQSLLNRIVNVCTPEARKTCVKEYLEIDDQNWDPTAYQVLDFIAWMNWAPIWRQREVNALNDLANQL